MDSPERSFGANLPSQDIVSSVEGASGTKTFRDGAGRMTGTAATDSNGTITFRDGAGRMTGTATSPRQRDRR